MSLETCVACNAAIGQQDFCHECGRPVRNGPALRIPWTRPVNGRWISGVCLAVAEHLRWPVWIVRLLFVLGMFLWAVSFVAYVVLTLAWKSASPHVPLDQTGLPAAKRPVSDWRYAYDRVYRVISILLLLCESLWWFQGIIGSLAALSQVEAAAFYRHTGGQGTLDVILVGFVAELVVSLFMGFELVLRPGFFRRRAMPAVVVAAVVGCGLIYFPALSLDSSLADASFAPLRSFVQENGNFDFVISRFANIAAVAPLLNLGLLLLLKIRRGAIVATPASPAVDLSTKAAE